MIRKNHPFWQQHNKSIVLSDNKIIEQKLDFLHINPVTEGVLFDLHEYKYSSAADYSGGKGMINVVMLV